MSNFGPEDQLAAILTGYKRAGHPIFVVLPTGQRDLHFLPFPLVVHVAGAPGRTLNLESSSRQPFTAYFECLKGHEIVFSVSTKHPSQGVPKTIPKVVDNLNRMVCAFADEMNVYLLHPPHRSLEAQAFKILVDFFGPEFAEPEPEPIPEWASSVVSAMPGIEQIESKTGEIARQVDGLEKEADDLNTQKQKIQKWAELLWLDGIPLQKQVREALNFLGFQTEMRDPTGHSEDLIASHGAYRFLIEVTGATGSIKIEKARELVQWILVSDSPGQVRGILVGNPFRKDPPHLRPPTPNHKLFTNEVEELATRFDFALLDVREIYRAIVAKLQGKEIDLTRMCHTMSGKGSVVFELSPSPKLAEKTAAADS